MSLLYSVVFGTRCRSNHHRLAVDALRFLKGPDGDAWRALLLHHHNQYLKGAKAPDDEFKDFKNHVLHVRSGEWGGAIEAAEEWRKRLVRAIKEQDWSHAAWCAGVMSHYVVDPFQPFHTHQTEEENVIHRAVEWSFSKSYGIFQAIIEKQLGGYPEDIALADGPQWLAEAIRAGARLSNQSYEFVIDHYNFAVGVKRPIEGCDGELQMAIAPLVARATVTWARVLDRVVVEAGVKPPKVDGSLQAFFMTLETPIQSVLKAIGDAQERAYVAKQYEEYKRTGKVRSTLSLDDTMVRALHADEVLKTPLSSLDARWPREIGTAYKPSKIKRGKKDVRKTKIPVAAAPAAAQPPMPAAMAPVAAAPQPVVQPPAAAAIAAPPPTAPAAASPFFSPGASAPLPSPPEPDIAEPPPAKKSRTAKALDADPPPREARAPKPEPAVEDEPETPPLLLTKKVVDKKKKGAPPPADDAACLLKGSSRIEDAPSIGPKTARRFHAIGIRTVSDLFALSPATAAVLLKTKHITAVDIADWQSEAMLACTLPDLRSREAQALVACGMRDIDTLAIAETKPLMDGLKTWATSREGQRAWGNAPVPDEKATQDLIERAKAAIARRPKSAA